MTNAGDKKTIARECGEDHVGLGTDGSISAVPLTDAYRESFRKEEAERIKAGVAAPGESPDDLTFVPEYNDPRRFNRLAGDLARRGWPGSRIDKLLGANFARLFTEMWDVPGTAGTRAAAPRARTGS
ncbi:MAG TPA: membrane dipeptidase [Steroidobacteraceae bacterium]|nr:membrane dipeptidase [Steroidobacteraceae bacterium]